MKQIFIFLCTVLAFSFSFAQTPNFTIFNTSNSLIPGNGITSLIIDNNGTKWMVTDGGIASFDNITWTMYDSIDVCFSSHPWIKKVYADENGNIWITTWGCGFWIFDGTNWTQFSTQNSELTDDYIRGFAVQQNGTVWIASNDQIQSFDGENWNNYDTSNSPLPLFSVFESIYCDYNDDVWIGGKYKFDGTDWETFNPPYESVSDIIFDLNNILWECAMDPSFIPGPIGLQSYDGSNWTTYNTWDSGIPNDQITCIAIDTSNVKWIGTWGGLAKYNDQNWVVFDTSNSEIPSNFINDIVIDNVGLKWIATNEGLVVLDDININSLSDYKLENNNIFIYPNPTINQINVSFSDEILNTKLDIFNTQGNLVNSLKIYNKTTTLDLKLLMSGIYFIRIDNGKSIVIKKIVKL